MGIENLLDEMGQTLQFTASFVAGLVLGLVNWAFWKWWAKGLVKEEAPKWGALAIQSVVKLTLLALILWVLITKDFVNPVPFLLGFSVVVIALIVKGFKWR